MSVKYTYEYYNVITSSGNVLDGIDDYLIEASTAGINVNLPSASGSGLKGKIFTFRRIDSTTQTVSIVPNGTDTINSINTPYNLDPYQVIKLIRNNTNNGWISLMENSKILSSITYTADSDINPSYDLHLINNPTTTAIVISPPATSSVQPGSRFILVCTSANTNPVTLAALGNDKINGSASLTISGTQNLQNVLVYTSAGNWTLFN